MPCLGLYGDITTVHGKEYSLKALKENYNEGKTSDKRIVWYSIPKFNFCKKDVEIKGTIKSSSCKQMILESESGTCSFCRELTREQSFLKRIQRLERKSSKSTASQACDNNPSHTRPLGSVNNKFLSGKHKLAKLKKYRERCNTQKIRILSLSKRFARLKSSKQKLSERIGECAKRGDVAAIIHNFNTAYKQGLLSGKSRLLKFVKNISQNLVRKSPRYDKYTKQIYECLRIIGGPRASRFIASNLCGPSDDTQRRTRRIHQFRYVPSKPSDRVFSHVAKIYSHIKAEKNISGDVLVETAEDETVIISKCEWDCNSDQVWGWCGVNNLHHKCDPDFVHIIGNDDNSYDELLAAFRNNRMAGFARIVMVNPIHYDLPPMVVLLQANCNKFDASMVREQWDEIKCLYDKHLLPVLGPLVGHAFDGDSRRRKLHLSNSTSPAGERYRIEHENFSHSGRSTLKAGKPGVEDLSDQDFMHNAKKAVNHLLHPSRVLSIGGNLCHINHLQLIITKFITFEHGLQENTKMKMFDFYTFRDAKNGEKQTQPKNCPQVLS